jgi:hypothetical protein
MNEVVEPEEEEEDPKLGGRMMLKMIWIPWKYIIGRTAFRTGINGKKPLRRPKHSMKEVVVEPEEEVHKITNSV